MFGILNFGHCNLFVICDFEFGIFSQKVKKIILKTLRLNALALWIRIPNVAIYGKIKYNDSAILIIPMTYRRHHGL